MKEFNRVYQALVTRIIDGDTVDCFLDLGFDVHIKARFRLYGINAPETRTTDLVEKQLGYNAKDFLTTAIFNQSVILHTYGKDKYGRWLCEIFLPRDDKSINQTMLEAGLVESYLP